MNEDYSTIWFSVHLYIAMFMSFSTYAGVYAIFFGGGVVDSEVTYNLYLISYAM
jgi:hypothetical protein